MAKTKKDEVLYSAKVDLHMTASQLAVPVDKSVVRSRGPKQLGQMKNNLTINLRNMTQEELVSRMELAKAILELGVLPTKINPKETLRQDTVKKETTKGPKKEIPEEKVSEDQKSDEK